MLIIFHKFATSLEEVAQESPPRPSGQAVLAALTGWRYAKRPQHASSPGRSRVFRSALALRQGGKVHYWYESSSHRLRS